MRKLTLFYMEGCPYCINAKKALSELQEENPEYGKIPMDWIDENRNPELAGRYDYYYVPTIFLGEEKLYEAHPSENYSDIKNKVKAALDAARVLG